MEISNRELICIDCGKNFIFSAGEQLFFKEKNFVNDPKRCKPCKAKRATENWRALPESQVRCEECGTATTVPFRPSQGRPVYCRACFQLQPKRPLNSKPGAHAHADNGSIAGGSRDGKHSSESNQKISDNQSHGPMRLLSREKIPLQESTATDIGAERSTEGLRLLKTS